MNRLERISRREFMQRTGYAGGGLVLVLSSVSAGCGPTGDGTGPSADSFAPNVYVNLLDSGTVQIYCHRSEMGQGIRTCLTQIIADELEADWDRVELLQAIGDERYGDQNTDGSTSIRKQFDLLRSAGATAREMLVAAAATAWGVPVDECEARNHAVHHPASGNSADYGDLVAKLDRIEIPQNPAFKSPAEYRYIGKSVDLIDGRAMTTGSAIYGTDHRLPGMLYASIERCPVHGGRVESYDDRAARAVPGVVDVIRMPDPEAPLVFKPLGGVAVVATNTWAAERGRAALEISWDPGPNAGYESSKYKEELLTSCCNEGTLFLERGDANGAISAASKRLSVEYYAPHLAQSPMEPPAATAHVRADGRCEVWASTQHPVAARDTVAATLGFDSEDVIVNVTLLGGGFGRKSKADFVAEAAWLAKETGKPVSLFWTREDDLRHGYFHAVSAQHLEAGLDDDNAVSGWLHRSAFPSISSTFSSDARGPSAMELGLGMIDTPFAVPNMRLESGDATAHVRIGWLRSVCNIYHAFAVCGFADELAHLAGEDPRDFVAKLIGPPRRIDPADDGATYSNYGQGLDTHPIDTARHVAVLDKAAEMAGWGRSLPDGHGLGIAVHRSFLTYVAVAAEVGADASGRIRVHELWMAVDAGTVINPDRVRSQMEGAAIYGMSLALHGEITAKDGAIEQGNFDTYPVIRMNEAPAAIHVHIIDSDAPPGGVGEPGVPPVAPAIVNAWFAASGQRVRELPLRYAGSVQASSPTRRPSQASASSTRGVHG